MKFQFVKNEPRTLDDVRKQFSGMQDARWRGIDRPSKREWQVWNRLDVLDLQEAERRGS